MTAVDQGVEGGCVSETGKPVEDEGGVGGFHCVDELVEDWLGV